MICKYKNIFGVSGQGVHSTRLLDVAMFDYIGTIVLAIIVSKFTKLPLVLSTILMFVLGLVLHWVFCVPTSALKFLGASTN